MWKQAQQRKKHLAKLAKECERYIGTGGARWREDWGAYYRYKMGKPNGYTKRRKIYCNRRFRRSAKLLETREKAIQRRATEYWWVIL